MSISYHYILPKKKERAIQTTRALGLMGVTLDTSGAGSTDIDAGTVSAARTVSATTSVDLDITTQRALGRTGVTLSTSAAGATDVDAGTVSVQRSTSVTAERPYSHDFFNSRLSVSASACIGGSSCETQTDSDTDTDFQAQNAAGQTLTVEYETDTVTANGSGTVIVRFLDGNGSQLGSDQDSFTGPATNDSFSFQAAAPTGTEQIEVERQVEADSQSTAGGGCSGDADCTNETAEISWPITISI